MCVCRSKMKCVDDDGDDNANDNDKCCSLMITTTTTNDDDDDDDGVALLTFHRLENADCDLCMNALCVLTNKSPHDS